MSTGHILLLGAIAGLTIFIGLPMGRLHDVGQSFKAFLERDGDRDPALPALGRAHRGGRAGRDRAERARLGRSSAATRRSPFGGFAVGLLSLVYYDSWMKARRRQELPRPGRGLGDRARALALRRPHAGALARALHRHRDRPAQLLRGPRDRAGGRARRAQPRLRARDRLRPAQRDRGLRHRRAADRRRRAAELALPRDAGRDRRLPDLLRHAGRPGVDVDGRLDPLPVARRGLDPLRRDGAPERLPALRRARRSSRGGCCSG